MDINAYLDQAKVHQGLSSDNQLSKRIGISQATISQMRTGRSWPGDATMVRIAELAGIDAREALLDLSMWRCRDTASRSVYQALMKDLKRSLRGPATAAGIAAISLTALSNPTATGSLNVEHQKADMVYIM
ncbi:hypothetical protein GCM10007972_04760 [Iodidimonas muriae]|uniref:HTH cro/C1-type domain-containing protein n=1 Tax=Iodidimonas muriae TaxID=261467 RepID=A0ABQ2L822_9PROT|nr:helix-turn-helix domain-containing protein [Iodidimonas muriae]GER08191.1 hypothetical protein JCM17843_25010 [Kordiimonadales bacterium JCM 17843]GGO06409.1 hypothetical protein GCM10007972_04760 [Iodidimonas muriae]